MTANDQTEDAVDYGLMIALLMRLEHATAVAIAKRLGTTSVNVGRWWDGAEIRSPKIRAGLRVIAVDELTRAQRRQCGMDAERETEQ